jgi:hypothetical protein
LPFRTTFVQTNFTTLFSTLDDANDAAIHKTN